METTNALSLASHGRTFFQLVGAPGKFFETRRHQLYPRASMGFLVISALLFTAASLVFQRCQTPMVTGAILLGNAVGMVIILSFIGYLVMVVSMGKKVRYRQLFSVYAYASGACLIAAWIPHLLIVSEPWRWCLIGIGLTRGCGLKLTGTIWIIIGSITVMTVLFRSLLPLMQA